MRRPPLALAVCVVLAVALGILIRLGAAATAMIWFDEATVGLMGRQTLRGEFVFFFHGQTYMGAVDAYLYALPFALLGSSVGTLRLWPLAASLLHVALCGLLARRLAGVGLWAILLALIPTPIVLKWAHDARLYYDLVLVLAPLLLLLALRAVDAGATPAQRTRALLAGGLVAGLGWWMNLLMSIPLMAATLVVLIRRPRLRRAAWGLPLAFLLGSAPFWVFALWRGHLAAAGVPLAPPGMLPEHGRLLVSNALPILLGVPQPLLASGAGTAFVAGSLVVLGLAVGVLLVHPGINRVGGLLVTAVVALSAPAVTLGEHGKYLGGDEPLYLVPVVAVLPVVLGVSLACLARLSRPAAVAAAAVLLVVHVVGLWVKYPALFRREEWQIRRAGLAAVAGTADRLAAAGLTAVYTHDPDVLTFVSAERVAVSHFYQERYPPLARAVDGAPRVAYYVDVPPRGFDQSLQGAGIRFIRERTPVGWLYTGFGLEREGYQEIPPIGWTATASRHPELAPHALDRDAGTQWDNRGPRESGLWFQVDLGRVHEVAMIAMLPRTFQQVPTGLRVETSLDAHDWTVVREIPEYYGPLYWAGGHPAGRVRWGRVEVRFPPRPTRYLRLTNLGEDRRFSWTIRELFVYEATEGEPDGRVDPGEAVDALRRAGVRRLYADHAVGARLAQASGGALAIQPDNLQVDLYGAVPAISLLPAFRSDGTTAIAYPTALPSARAIEGVLDRAGWSFDQAEAGGYRVLTRVGRRALPGSALPPRGWKLSGSPGSADTGALLDGRLDTRWATRAPQKHGDWLQVDLPEPTLLVGVDLDLGPYRQDYPRGLALEIARDDGSWELIPATPFVIGPLRWAGTHLLREGAERVALRFSPLRIRSLRLIQTGADPVFDWSVAELRLLAP